MTIHHSKNGPELSSSRLFKSRPNKGSNKSVNKKHIVICITKSGANIHEAIECDNGNYRWCWEGTDRLAHFSLKSKIHPLAVKTLNSNLCLCNATNRNVKKSTPSEMTSWSTGFFQIVPPCDKSNGRVETFLKLHLTPRKQAEVTRLRWRWFVDQRSSYKSTINMSEGLTKSSFVFKLQKPEVLKIYIWISILPAIQIFNPRFIIINNNKNTESFIHSRGEILLCIRPILSYYGAVGLSPGSNWGFSALLKDTSTWTMGRAGIEPVPCGYGTDALPMSQFYRQGLNRGCKVVYEYVMTGLQTATNWSHFAPKIRHNASKFVINSRMRDQ